MVRLFQHGHSRPCTMQQDMERGLPFVVVNEAPAVTEKPSITVDANGYWTLNVPPVHFREGMDSASSVNAKLAE